MSCRISSITYQTKGGNDNLTASGAMDWKVFVLVAILPSALSLPMELCCQSSSSSSSSISSSSLNVKLDSSIPVSDSEMLEPFISPSISSSKTPDPLLMLMPQQHQESPSCCGNDNDLPTEKKQVKRTRMKIRGTTSSGLRRTKRFPIHLDPLYQYRYLARSGRKSYIMSFVISFVLSTVNGVDGVHRLSGILRQFKFYE